MPAAAQPEARVVAARGPGPLVGNVDELPVHGDAYGLDSSRGHWAALGRGQCAVLTDAQHGDLVAAGVGGEQVTTIGGDLQRTLRAEDRPRPGAAGGERGAAHRCQGSVRVLVE